MGKNKRARERERRGGSGGSDMTRLYIIVGVVAVIAVVAVGYSVRGRAFAGNMATVPVEVPGLEDRARLAEIAQGVSAGDEDAPITIIEFGDYQCPSCGQFFSLVKPRVDLTYIETGQARFVFYDFPLVNAHPHAFLAARAARCAGDQDLYWQYHEALFRNQASWSPTTSPAGMFVDFAEQVGADVGDFQSCLSSDRHADVVTANMQLGMELMVNQTPTIIVGEAGSGGSRLGSPAFESIQAAVEAIQQGQQGG